MKRIYPTLALLLTCFTAAPPAAWAEATSEPAGLDCRALLRRPGARRLAPGRVRILPRDIQVRADETSPIPTATAQADLLGVRFKLSWDLVSGDAELSLPKYRKATPVVGNAFRGDAISLSHEQPLLGVYWVSCRWVEAQR